MADGKTLQSLYSTSKLVGIRYGVDTLSAAVTALCVSPIVTIIDSTIIMKAAKGGSFRFNLKKFIQPLSTLPSKLFSRPSRLVFLVYFGTFLTANCLDTTSSISNDLPASTVTASSSKFAATAVISTGLTVYKDSQLAQIFGGTANKSAIPLASYFLFTVRDTITIFASFNLPTILAPKLVNILDTETKCLNTAQFAIPAMIQFITTPIHLLGLDLHNRRCRVGVQNRIAYVKMGMPTAIPARIIRILPAFGFGGVVNLSTRTRLMNQINT